MPLSEFQQSRIRTYTAQQIADLLIERRVTHADLQAMAAATPAFAIKLAEAIQIVERTPAPAEIEEYNAAKTAYENHYEDADSLMSRYVVNWSANGPAAERVAEIKRFLTKLREEKSYNYIMPKATDAVNRYNANGEVPSEELLDAVNSYVATYGNQPDTPAHHLSSARSWLDSIGEIVNARLQEEWDVLFDQNGILKDINSLRRFLTTHPNNPKFSADADNAFWDWALVQEDVMGAVREYDNYFHGMGSHSHEARSINAKYAEWQQVDKANFHALSTYIRLNPSSPFINAAKRARSALKEKLLERMRVAPHLMLLDEFKDIYTTGTCTREEMIEATQMTEDFFNILTAAEAPIPPDAPNPSERAIADAEPNRTDIIFFGMPSSGKTCVLTGLLSSQRMGVHADNWSGDYGQYLRVCGSRKVAPPPTASGFVAAIGCYILRDQNSQVPFNLIDMAGEVFSERLRTADSTVSFEDMGLGATEIISNPNDKVFFFVLDPTAVGQRKEDQKTAVNKVLGLIMSPVNKDVAAHMRGLHFIVTKADRLGDNRLQKAHTFVRGIINEAEANHLSAFCRDNAINVCSDSNLNGRPRVFCFSLGRFYPGNTFMRVTNDDDVLLNIIQDYCLSLHSDTAFDKIRNVLTQPRF